MWNWVKKVLLVLVVAFALYYLVTRPEDAAAAVRNFFGLFESVGVFFSNLANS